MPPPLAERLRALLDSTLDRTDLPGLPEPERGKVRDVYDLGPDLLIVTTDRVSAFDVVCGTVPCKGQVLNAIAAHCFERSADLAPNHLRACPDPNAMLVRKLDPLPVEVIVRRYISGSLWRDYSRGERRLYGIELPDGLRADERFDELLVTPTSKAGPGEHDAPLSTEEILSRGLVAPRVWERVRGTALALFARGEQEAASKGLILVDSKYEFGLDRDTLYVMDEIHTPDSSRYWEADGSAERFEAGQPQRMLDKENVRQWLRERGFEGHGRPPPLDDEVRVELARAYLELQRRLLGEPPELPADGLDVHARLVDSLARAGILKGP
ncbi:MAG: phosphoribosylaminoimidazolesuccinocarboxamide synthase [Deltaproteobacteria bacterium]|nr:phosphoribosylaminoimidazolesuccinocarboxamide synthase [Deltaproteobacteria bacterium]